jgi:hypothetical protein
MKSPTWPIQPPQLRWRVLVVLVLLGLTAHAGQTSAASPTRPNSCADRPAFATATCSSPIFGSWFETHFNNFASALKTRQGMVQFGFIGMAVGLFIIWYRKP